ncbi:hypothetical protein GHD73_22225, partial [Shigella flexneri]|nr:hypothetical protein [Shigella flexneri]
YARQGVELSRNTMVRWVSEMADKLRPLYIALNDYVLEAGKVHADDTVRGFLYHQANRRYAGGFSGD